MRIKTLSLFVSLAALVCAAPAAAWEARAIKTVAHEIRNATQNQTTVVEPAGKIEVGFSPNGGAEHLVIKVIDSAMLSIRIMAYSFTSKPIAEALLAAYRRGVDIKVVVDKSQLSERYTSATFLANERIPVRVDSMHAIQHNKVLIVDGETVETGSFNFTAAAASRNAENAVVVWKTPKLAAAYQKDWETHWAHSEPYAARY